MFYKHKQFSLSGGSPSGFDSETSCLICSSQSQSSSIESSNLIKSSCSSLSNSLINYFVLGRILDIPQVQLEYYLRNDPGPEKWISVCVNCSSKYVEKCLQLYSELKETERKLDVLKSQIKQVIKKSKTKSISKKRTSPSWNLSEEVRHFISNQNEPEKTNARTFKDGDVLAEKKATETCIHNKGNDTGPVDAYREGLMVKEELENACQFDDDLFDMGEGLLPNSPDREDFNSECQPDEPSSNPCPGLSSIVDTKTTLAESQENHLEDTEHEINTSDLVREFTQERHLDFLLQNIDSLQGDLTSVDWQCPNCDKVYKSGPKLNSHLSKCNQEVSRTVQEEDLNRCPVTTDTSLVDKTIESVLSEVETCPVPTSLPNPTSSTSNRTVPRAKVVKTVRARQKKPGDKSNPKPYMCEKCSKTFALRDSLNFHIQKTDCLNRGPWTCPYCPNKYKFEANFKFHLLQCKSGNGNPTIPCASAAVATTPSELPPPDPEEIPITGDPTCPKCKFVFKFHFHLRLHLEKGDCIASSEPQNQCPKCLRTFTLKSRLDRHKCDEPPIYSCDQCDFKSIRQYVVSFHKITDHPEDPNATEVPCPHCFKKVFSTQNLADLQVHIRRCVIFTNLNVPKKKTETNEISEVGKKVEVDPDNPWRCDICGSCFRTKQLLKDHHDAVHTDKIHLCQECGYKTKHRKNFKRHLRWNHNPNVDPEKLKCPFCQKKFNNGEYVQYHIARMHDPTRQPHDCKECGKDFRGPYALRTHMKKKHGAPKVNSHLCGKCGRTFPYQCLRDKHESRCGVKRTRTFAVPYTGKKRGRPRKVQSGETTESQHEEEEVLELETESMEGSVEDDLKLQMPEELMFS